MALRVGLVAPHPVNRRAASRIKQVLEQHLHEFGVESVKISPGHDHDGDPVIFIDVVLRITDIDADAVLEALSHLRSDLLNQGEMRFPHLRHLSGEPHHGAAIQ